jgi:hypothetical protein
MNKRLLNVIRVVISVGLLAFVLWTNDPSAILAELRQGDLRYLLAAFVLFLFGLIIRAYRWLVLVRGLAPAIPFGRLLNLYFVGQFFSTFLPTTYGGDVVRALELTQDSNSSAAIGTVLLDRLTGLMMLALIGLIVLPFQIGRIEPWLVWVLLGLMLAILGGGALVVEGNLLRRLTSHLPSQFSLVGQGPLAKIYTAVTGCGRRAVLSAFGVSIAFNLVNILINWLCGKAMGIGVSLGFFFVISPLFSISGLIPSIGGWGVRETLSTATFGSVDSEKAAAWGIALGLVMLAAGLVGGIVYLVGSVHAMLVERRSEGDTPPVA